MYRRWLFGLLIGASPWAPSTAAPPQGAPIIELTHEGALARAREQSPTLATARARAREAERRVDAASVWRFNPQLSAALGPRFSADDTTVDWSLGAQQWLEAPGQRDDRVAAARAGAAAGAARSEDTQRLVVRDVSLAFISALYWGRRLVLAQENLRIAEAVARIATRRHEVGDAGRLEQSVAALAVLRAQGDAERGQAALTRAKGHLKMLLGIDAEAAVSCLGDLRQLGVSDGDGGDVDDRPDLHALRADIRRAEAEAELGRARRVPSFAVGAAYAREESDDVVKGTFAIALPVFDHGQGATAIAEARRARAQAELDAARSAAAV